MEAQTQEQNEAAEIPAAAEQKFEVRGFMSTDPAAAEKEAFEAAKTAGEISAEEADIIAARIQGRAPPEAAGDKSAESVPVPQAAAAEAPKKEEAKIKIGDKEFTKTEEAWAYAQELEREKLAADAFRQGIEAATVGQKGNPAPAEEPKEKFDEQFYANPEEYLKKREQQIEAKVLGRITQETEMKARNEKTWNEFYSEYPDLVNSKELVQITLQQNWEALKFADTKKALKIVAEHTREKRKKMLEDLLPSAELKRVTTVASPGNTVQVTQKAQEEKPLNFVSQFRTMRQRRSTKAVRR